MFPSLHINNGLKRIRRDPWIASRQTFDRTITCILSPYLPNHPFVQNGSAAALASCRAISGIAIAYIVSLSASLKVIGIYAGRIITAMSDQHPFRNCAEPLFVSDSMRVGVAVSPAHNTIPFAVDRTGPYPTFVWWPNPEALKKSKTSAALLSVIGACATAISPPSCSKAVRLDGFFRQFLSALQAGMYDHFSQGGNLRRQVSFWSGSLECSNTLAGRLYFNTI